MDLSLSFQHFLALVMVEASGILEGLDKDKMAKSYRPLKISCGEEPGQSEGVIKGEVENGGGAGEGRIRLKRKGSGKKGVRMEMLLQQPSLEPELCIGKAAQIRSALCGIHSAQQLDTLRTFSKAWESIIMLTSFSSGDFFRK